MTHKEPIRISRRRLLAMAGLSAGATLLSRRPLFAESEGVVPTMIHAAENAKITVHPLRRNISVLEGSGGNIAVLTGKDGKLLVDAGLAVSRPAITNALTSINADPLQHLVNTHWHMDHTDGNNWLHSVRSGDYRSRECSQASFGGYPRRGLELDIPGGARGRIAFH